MDQYPRAKRLTEVAAAVDLEPLESGDPRYVDISAGRGTDHLKRLRLCLMDYDAADDHFAKIAVTGHRGCGKTTELFRLEHEIANRFTSLHIFAHAALLGDYNYTDLFLWIVDELVRKFEDERMPLDPALAKDVADWFAAVAIEDVEKVKSEIELEAEAQGVAKAGLMSWLTMKLMARLKSMVVGSTEHRKVVRQELQARSSDLIDRVNLLLDNAHQVLRAQSKPANLLIVVDNLDRLAYEAVEPLFFQNGDRLKLPRAHLIYTVPIANVVAPNTIRMVFDRTFTLPMIKVRTPRGKGVKAGLDALVQLVDKRIDLDACFASPAVVRKLAEMSGGNVRDLLRLIDNAQLSARVEEKETIENAAVKRAVAQVRLDYERTFIPGNVYYPLLAQIHRSKGEQFRASPETDPDPVKTHNLRVFFNQFLFNGSVLEYNGEATWYDVHPVVQEIKRFQEAVAHVESQENTPKTPD
jgi:hypothetical protein